MLPSTFIQHGLNAEKSADGDQSANSSASRVAATAGPRGEPQRLPLGLGASNMGASGADFALLDSMIAQEQQRRRNLLLAASSPFAQGGGAASGMYFPSAANSAASALLAAERQRALLLEGGLLGALDRDLLSINRLGLSSFGGLGSALNSFASGAGAASFLAQATGPMRSSDPFPGQRDALTMFSNPALLLAAHQQQHSAPPVQSSIANDQLLLDAMEQGGRKGRTGTFPQKLHQMLSDLEKEEGGSEIASYLPHGRAFAIHKPNEFVKKIMPKYFRMSRFSSFQRQLNLYEFMRITDGPDKGAYFHELFHRGRPVLASQIRRNKIKGESNTSGVKRDRPPLIAGGNAAYSASPFLPGRAQPGGLAAAPFTQTTQPNSEKRSARHIALPTDFAATSSMHVDRKRRSKKDDSSRSSNSDYDEEEE